MSVSTKAQEDLITKEDFEGKPNADFIPDKKDGHWSFAHDKKQIVGDYDYVPNNSLLKKKIEELAKFISDDDLLHKEHSLDEVVTNKLKTIENVLKKAENYKSAIRNVEELKIRINENLGKMFSEVFPLYDYCQLDKEEYIEAKENFDDSIAILEIQTNNISNSIDSTMLQLKQIHEMLEKYSEKKSILGD